METINGEIKAHATVTPAPMEQILHAFRFSRVKSCWMKRKTEHFVKATETRRRMRLAKTSWHH
jgi:predicted component of type VI protein secretion system